MTPEEREHVHRVLRKRPDLLPAFGMNEAFELVHFPQYVTSDAPDEERYFLAAMADEVCTVPTDGPKSQK